MGRKALGINGVKAAVAARAVFSPLHWGWPNPLWSTVSEEGLGMTTRSEPKVPTATSISPLTRL
jgi:hypothetical protein